MGVKTCIKSQSHTKEISTTRERLHRARSDWRRYLCLLLIALCLLMGVARATAHADASGKVAGDDKAPKERPPLNQGNKEDGDSDGAKPKKNEEKVEEPAPE